MSLIGFIGQKLYTFYIINIGGLEKSVGKVVQGLLSPCSAMIADSILAFFRKYE